MSRTATYKLWMTSKKDMKNLIKKQDVLKKLDQVEEKPLQFQLFSEMYILYADLINKLTQVYLHTLQVQKRGVVRNLLDSALNRFMEIKETLKGIELNEYVYMDKILMKRKLCPSDLMIWKSPNFLFRRPPELQNIHCGNRLFPSEEQKQQQEKIDEKEIHDACILIQAHERARKARIYQNLIKSDKSKLKVKTRMTDYHFTFDPDTNAMSVPVKKTIYSEDYIKKTDECLAEFNEADNLGAEEEEDPEVLAARREKAALVIQKCWKQYKEAKMAKLKKKEEQYILGMKLKRKIFNPKAHEEDMKRMYQLEKERHRLDDEFLQLIQDERTRIFQERAPWIMEDISDHIRAWFLDFYEKLEAFHPYPDEVKGGTVLVLKDETMDYEEFKKVKDKGAMTKEEKKKEAEKAKAQRQKEKEKAKKEKEKIKKKLKKLRDKGIIPLGYDLQNNKNIQLMEETLKNYSIDWRFIDEYLNKYHEPIKDWVTEDELAKAHQELRLVVDEYMRTEWELLQKALCMDLGKKYKPSKNKKAKKKGKKGKKKKGPKDLTPDRTLESLYLELKDNGFIEQPPRKSFHDYIAEFNFLADATRDEDNLTTLDPSIGDIKALVEESILGMGEINVTKPKSLLFIGPFLSGKRLLCNIIASEIDALVINLSPEKTAHLDPENMEYFLHVVMKVAKNFEPTILYFEDAHRLFWKKIPPESENLNPRLLSTYLQKKIIKPIKKEDRIMLIGNSDLPWSAKGKFKKIFQKIILIPKTDYGTAFLMWLNLLEENIPDQIEDYQISALTKVLRKYQTGDIVENVKETLNPKRKMLLNLQKFKPDEFLNTFIEKPEPQFPLTEKIWKKYYKWYNKSNKLAKKRAKFYKEKLAKAKKK